MIGTYITIQDDTTVYLTVREDEFHTVKGLGAIVLRVLNAGPGRSIRRIDVDDFGETVHTEESPDLPRFAGPRCATCHDTGILETMYYGDHPVNNYCTCLAGKRQFSAAVRSYTTQG